MDDLIPDVVRNAVGRRYRISRDEMRHILVSLGHWGFDLRNDCVPETWDYDRDGNPVMEQNPVQISRAACRWANMCRGITVVSVAPRHAYPHGSVRFDSPGAMAPGQRAVLMFAPEELGGYEYDQIGQLRRKAWRVLVVSGPYLCDGQHPLPACESLVCHQTRKAQEAARSKIDRLRRVAGIDGVWARVLDDGTLELRDPNQGQGHDPRGKTRYQYRLDEHGNVLFRHLPPEIVGDAWEDIGVPEWEPSPTPPVNSVVRDWWEHQVL